MSFKNFGVCSHPALDRHIKSSDPNMILLGNGRQCKASERLVTEFPSHLSRERSEAVDVDDFVQIAQCVKGGWVVRIRLEGHDEPIDGTVPIDQTQPGTYTQGCGGWEVNWCSFVFRQLLHSFLISH